MLIGCGLYLFYYLVFFDLWNDLKLVELCKIINILFILYVNRLVINGIFYWFIYLCYRFFFVILNVNYRLK